MKHGKIRYFKLVAILKKYLTEEQLNSVLFNISTFEEFYGVRYKWVKTLLYTTKGIKQNTFSTILKTIKERC